MTTAVKSNSQALVGTGGAGVLSPAGVYVLPIALQLVAMTTNAADLMTGYVMPHRGKILGMSFVTTKLGTGTSASQVLNLEIGSTDLTGGVLTLLLADTTPLGKITAATPITGNNEFEAGDAISLEVAASGTAFTAGDGVLMVTIQNLDG